ncbi:MAG: site-specific integrase [Daejeonella sp.]
MRRKNKSDDSFKVVPDTRISKTGQVKFYFRMRIAGVKQDYSINVRWDKNFIDRHQVLLLPRFKNDPDVQTANLKLNHIRSLANRIAMDAYLHNKTLTFESFTSQFESEGSPEDFLFFMTTEINWLYNKSIIRYSTWKQHRSSLKTFTTFLDQPVLPFSAFDLDLIRRFDVWAKGTHGKMHNTVCGFHKDLKKYLNRAVEKKIITENPYKQFKFAYVDGQREALDQEEVSSLIELYRKKSLPVTQQEVLRRFLFSCFTGIRISDTHQVRKSMVIKDVLIFKPKKGERFGKTLKIPLPEAALKLIEDSTDLLFTKYSDKHINETLKFIAARVDIFKNLTYHCARDTFGTLMIEMGADIKSLADLMGHHSTKTTEIYIKMTDKRKTNLMANFDKHFSV